MDLFLHIEMIKIIEPITKFMIDQMYTSTIHCRKGHKREYLVL